jgi:FkbH-like protein
VVVSAAEAELRAQIEDALSRGDAVHARALLERLWRLRPGPALAGFVTSRLARLPPLPTQRAATVAVLRSFTIEPVVPVVRAAAAVNGIDLTVHVGDFNTYGQDLLDPTRPLHTTWNADVVIVAVQLRDVAPALWDGFAGAAPEDIDAAYDQVAGQFTALVEGFRRLSGAALVLHGFEQPSHAALGPADRTAARSQRDVIRRLNDHLGTLADAHRDVHVLDYDAVVARVGRANWLDSHKWHTMKAPIRAEHLADLAAEWLRFVQPIIGKVAKALVVDLDNTLWGGVLGEDGIGGIRVGPESGGSGYAALQRALLDVRARGVLLGICSKNNPAEVTEALERHPELLLRADAFSAIRVNWESKVDNLRSIAAELNIGIDSIAFLDDSTYECDLIRQLLPEVSVIELEREPTDEANPIDGHPLFQRLRLVDEDRLRADYYANELDRRQAMDSAVSLEDFLESLGTVVSIVPATAAEVERVAQLTQKTNQFNLTTRRYSEQDIVHFLDDPAAEVLVARAADRFGDHGLVGVVIARDRDAIRDIDTMLLSCRVIGRGVERAMLAVLADRAVGAGATTIRGTFIPTLKNAPASAFFEEVGFTRTPDVSTGEGPDASTWQIEVDGAPIEAPAWIDVRTADDKERD